MPKRILIVEDERPLAHALELKLQFEGFEVLACSNGKEGLEAILAGKADLVLLDLMMPEMDGFQVLRESEKMAQRPPIFVISNLSQHEDEDRVLSAGATRYFIKSDTPLSTIIGAIKQELKV